ncbi:MAG: SAM-dependent methyltransferase, partial [Candidatus Dadabacteria bacterium]|nr:SAM-dependent methyltransferase [Candidatus Dadabacteria bacterium]
SLTAVNRIFELNGLQIFDIEKLSSHGGSLRVFAQRMKTGQQPVSKAVHELLKREDAAGMKTKDYYRGFQQRADEVKYDMLNFLLNARSQGKKVMAYGAAAKG